MDAINIGPLSFRVGLIVTFAAILLGLAVGNRAARARGVRVEPMLWVVIGAGVLAARIGFVLQYLDMYARAPLGMLNIRDGGFSAPIGAVAAAGAAVWLAWRDRDRRRPLAVGVLAGAAVGMIGALLTVLLPARQVAMPALSFSGLDGRTIRLESLAGKPVVINLWASWCPPCRREMPILRQAQFDHPELTFVFANQGETPDAVRKYLAAERIALDNVLLDARFQLGAATGSQALPTTLFFSAQGKLVERHPGELSAATLAQRLGSFGAAR